MPTYTFQNTETKEIVDEFLSLSERELFIKQNPHMKQIIGPVTVIGGHGDRVRTDDGFKSVLSKVAEAHPNSKLADKVGANTSIKGSKARDVVRKHSEKQRNE